MTENTNNYVLLQLCVHEQTFLRNILLMQYSNAENATVTVLLVINIIAIPVAVELGIGEFLLLFLLLYI